MRKLTILILMVFGYSSNANAIEGVNLGVSLTAGKFEAKGAKEEFKGAHVGDASPGDVTKNASSEGDVAEGAFGIGSLFIEYELNDVFAFGVDYVPHTLDTETTENKQTDSGTMKTNTVQVDFDDMYTVYAILNFPEAEGLYAKIGYTSVDVVTNENLGTGGAYPDTDIDGYTLGLGYNRDLNDGAFVRLEANYIDLDGATLKNSNDSTKSITADGVDGYGARISVGKAF